MDKRADVTFRSFAPPPAGTRRNAAKTWAIFVLVGLTFYCALYAWSEVLVLHYGLRNRFFMVHMAPAATYDEVILGASHAMPFDFADMNDRLEQATGGKIINLSVEGAGILPNRLLLDYFFRRHQAKTIVYLVDSFAFYSRQWNEERINDAGLFKRAPLDNDLLRVLWRHPWARPMLPGYASGFLKINNADRFAKDVSDMEATKFLRVYRPVPQIDRQRIDYLYPETIDPLLFQHYLAAFEDLIQLARRNNAGFVVIKPPTPARYRDNLPKEAEFDATLRGLLMRNGVPMYDLSATITDDRLFCDTDHLNRDGVIASIDGAFGTTLRAAGPN